MNNLAITYRALGRHSDALAVQESVLEFRRQILPPNHPKIGDSMNNLALTYGSLGRHADALAMQESALEFRRRILPPNHASTVVSAVVFFDAAAGTGVRWQNHTSWVVIQY